MLFYPFAGCDKVPDHLHIEGSLESNHLEVIWDKYGIYLNKPTFNSKECFAVGVTAFSGIVTVTPGKSGWLNEPPQDVMV